MLSVSFSLTVVLLCSCCDAAGKEGGGRQAEMGSFRAGIEDPDKVWDDVIIPGLSLSFFTRGVIRDKRAEAFAEDINESVRRGIRRGLRLLFFLTFFLVPLDWFLVTVCLEWALPLRPLTTFFFFPPLLPLAISLSSSSSSPLSSSSPAFPLLSFPCPLWLEAEEGLLVAC